MTYRKVAALYDVHGNLPALEAVLADVEREQPDLIVFGGDLAPGWYPVEVLERVRAVPNTRFVNGNCDRIMVELVDNGFPAGDHELTDSAARKLSPADRDFLAAFEPTVEIDIEGLGRVLFCHATPHSDEDVITPLTPEPEAEAELEGAPPVVVYGHIHVQGDRGLPRHRLINPGAVGLAYGTNAACWALLGPDAELRQTDYDVNQAVPRLAAAPGWEGAPKWAESRRHPPSAQQALEQFEGQRKQRA